MSCLHHTITHLWKGSIHLHPVACLTASTALLWAQHPDTWCNDLEGLRQLTGQLPSGVLVNQSLSQSISQSVHRSVNQSVSQSINKSVSLVGKMALSCLLTQLQINKVMLSMMKAVGSTHDHKH